MFAEIIKGIKSALTIIKRLQQASRLFRIILCAIQTYEYAIRLRMALTLFKKIFGEASSELKDLLESMLGVSTIDEAIAKLDNTIDQVQEYVNKGKEIQARLDMVPSNLNGSHKPPYASTVFLEVIYAYDNVLGYGNLILIFNPVGFGMKPKDPQIIKYVSEKEMSAFIGSRSWGEYWRTNFLLKRPAHFNAESIDLLTGERHPSPRAETLTNFVENVADVDGNYTDVISDVFKEQIEDAFKKQEDVSRRVIRGIENNSLSRGFEEKGLRITDLLGQKVKAIPKNIELAAKELPLVREAAQYTAVWKKYSTKLRNSRTFFSSAVVGGKLEAEALAIGQSLGGGLLTEATMLKAYPEATMYTLKQLGLTASVASGDVALGMKAYQEKVVLDIFNETGTGSDIYSSLKAWEDMETGEIMWTQMNGEELTAEMLKEIKDLDKARKLEKVKEQIRQWTRGFSGALKQMLKPPDCILTVFT